MSRLAGSDGRQDDPLAGSVLGAYTLVRRVARGGQSSIYEARRGTERVAIKLVHSGREPSPEAMGRLRREAKALQSLQHENVVRILDWGESGDGNPWFAMEYLEGESLAALLERVGTLPEAEVVALLTPVCAALEQAHRLGIVHRDLKPQNIFLARAGGATVPKILDFGIAALHDSGTLTNSVMLSGTPMYMAPEQWEGLSHAEARSDVYALGVIAYQALSGKYAFEADTPLAWMKKVQFETPLDLVSAMGERPVSPAFASAVMKALAKNPAERPQTPMELLRSLRPAPPSTVSPKVARVGSRGLVVTLLVVLATLLGVAIGFNVSRRAPAAATGQRTTPMVVLMDTPVPRGVYDADALAHGGTNADTLNDALRDLPITIEKETLPSTWDREHHVLELKPDVIVIHRSAFFHGLNVEFGFGYEPFPDGAARDRWELLYRTAEDKLIAFMGLVGTSVPTTRFLVYSRGTGPTTKSGWPTEEYRRDWVTGVERRFPALRGRVTTLAVAGGVASGSFRNPEVIRQVRAALTSVLASSKR
ncbi:MAG TPA: serine/threonine-protein kinase [Polyangiaceae bacterium]|nr:serine/threonine-protein kinase [Polyangiaceae bacterium]